VNQKKNRQVLGKVVQTCYLRTGEAEAGESQIQSQSELHSENLSKNKKPRIIHPIVHFLNIFSSGIVQTQLGRLFPPLDCFTYKKWVYQNVLRSSRIGKN
jgi:hypothetical protein